MNKVVQWGEAHPYVSAGVIVGVGLLVLWWLGVFGSGTAAASSSSGNLAGAYYAAETAQTQAGTALAIAQSQNTAAVAGAQIQAGAATAIAQTQANRDVLLGSQTASTDQLAISTSGNVQLAGIQTTGAVNLAGIAGDVTKAGYDVTKAGYSAATTQSGQFYADQTARALSSDNLVATNTANALAAGTAQHASDTALAYGQSHDQAMIGLAYEQTVLPAQFASETAQHWADTQLQYGQDVDRTNLAYGVAVLNPGKSMVINTPTGKVDFGQGALSPDQMRSIGFSESQIKYFWGG